jgi:hypothetical protein
LSSNTLFVIAAKTAALEIASILFPIPYVPTSSMTFFKDLQLLLDLADAKLVTCRSDVSALSEESDIIKPEQSIARQISTARSNNVSLLRSE